MVSLELTVYAEKLKHLLQCPFPLKQYKMSLAFLLDKLSSCITLNVIFA